MTVDSTQSVTTNRRTDFWLTVANGALSQMGTAFFAAETVLAGLVYTLTESSVYVALLISVGRIGWMWPQLIISNVVEPLPRKMPFYILSGVSRFSLLIVLAACLFFWQGGNASLYWIILLIFAVFSSCGGIVVVPFMEILAKTVPRENQPMVWAWRGLFGGLLGFLASLVVASILALPGDGPHLNRYALLVLIGALFNGIAFGCYACIREPAQEVAKKRLPFKQFLRRGKTFFQRDPDYRKLFLLRCAVAVAGMSEAVYVPFAARWFNAPLNVTGGYFTGVMLVTLGMASLFWGWASRRYGEVRIITIGSALFLASPAIALTMNFLRHNEGTADFVMRHYLVGFVLMYMMAAIAATGVQIAQNVYLLTLPPANLRPGYVAFMNTLTVPLLLAPTLAGMLSQWIAFSFTFAVGCTAAVVSFILAYNLKPRFGTYPDLGPNEATE